MKLNTGQYKVTNYKRKRINNEKKNRTEDKELWGSIKGCNICIIRIQKKKKEGRRNIQRSSIRELCKINTRHQTTYLGSSENTKKDT